MDALESMQLQEEAVHSRDYEEKKQERALGKALTGYLPENERVQSMWRNEEIEGMP